MAQAKRHASKQDFHSKHTRDHGIIRAWVEDRKGVPAVVNGTEILRIDFQEPEETLEQISWDEFFRVFDDRDLEFVYQEHTEDGKLSRFSKFVRAGSAG